MLTFLGGAYYLSRHAEDSVKDRRKYGSDVLVKAIKIHNKKNKNGSSKIVDPGEPERTRQVIQYGGGVERVTDPSSKTYYFDDTVPQTNEGQPGQPLPLTGNVPMNPVYK
jgi:hypothetical protein